MAKKGLNGVTDVFRSDNLKTIGATMAGIVAGNFINDKVDDMIGSTGVSGISDYKGYIAPVITAVLGYTIGANAQNDILRKAGFGVTVAGGVKFVNKLMGKQVVSLGEPEDSAPNLIPGVGDVPVTPGQTVTDAQGNEYVYVEDTPTNDVEGVGQIGDYDVNLAGSDMEVNLA